VRVYSQLYLLDRANDYSPKTMGLRQRKMIGAGTRAC
jgi:hypothetical protein